MRQICLIACISLLMVALGAPPADALPITGGKFGVDGGIATGEGDIGTGWILGANYRLMSIAGPVSLRADVTYQSHGSDLSVVGLAGNAVFSLGSLYGLGGAGWYRSDRKIGDQNNDLGVQLGVGLSLIPGIHLEARWVQIDNFTTFPVVVGIRL